MVPILYKSLCRRHPRQQFQSDNLALLACLGNGSKRILVRYEPSLTSTNGRVSVRRPSRRISSSATPHLVGTNFMASNIGAGSDLIGGFVSVVTPFRLNRELGLPTLTASDMRRLPIRVRIQQSNCKLPSVGYGHC